VLDIDNDAVRDAQVKRLEQLKRERDASAVREALESWSNALRTGEGNLLECAVDAARKRATLGEISTALEMCGDATRPRRAPSPACTPRRAQAARNSRRRGDGGGV
jgi:methylmalonyl-CoA mutase N-terminal domain/subunit